VGKRYFTLDGANALVPRLAEIMRRLLQLHSHLRTAVEMLTKIGMPVSTTVLSGEEEVECEPEVRQLYAHARGFYEAILEAVEAIQDLGAEVKDVESGLVDFHSLLDGSTEVLLSWQVGESKIGYFRLPEASVSGRQPVEGHDFVGEPRAIH
jgi:hypothetical protein